MSMERLATVNRNFLSELRDLAHSVYDYENQKFLEAPRGRLKSKQVGEEAFTRIKAFIEIINDTSLLSDETKTFIQDKDRTYDDVKEIMSKQYGKECNRSTIQSKTWADKNKVIRFFGTNVLREITSGKTDVERLRDIDATIEELRKKYAIKNKLSSLALPLGKISGKIREIEEGEFTDFIQIIAPYSKSHIKFICESIVPDVVEYARKILDTQDNQLQDKEKEHKKLLLDLLR